MLKSFLATASTLTLGILCFLSFLCFAGSAIASGPSPAALSSAAEPSAAEEKQESADPAPEIRRVITGRVFDEIGNGVAGARASLRSAARNSPLASTKTDASGRFTLDSPMPGRVVLRVEHPDYAFYRHGWILDPLKDESKNLSITLVEGAEIRGRLLGLEGERRGVIFVSVGQDLEPSISSDRVRDDHYRLRHVPVGRWKVSARNPGGGQLARAEVEVSAPSGVVEQDLDFRQGVSFSGRIRHDQGFQWLPRVALFPEDSRPGYVTGADRQGNFRVSGLPKGRYKALVLAEQEPITARFLLDLQSDLEMDIDITPALLVGKVQSQEDASIQVSIQKVEPHLYYRILEVEEDGSFEKKMPPGRYRLLFTQQGSRIEERIVDLAPGSGPATGEEIRGLEVELSPAEPWKVRLELPGDLHQTNAELMLEREDGVILWRASFDDLGDEAIQMPVRPYGQDWRLLVYVAGAAAEEIPAKDLRADLTTIQLDPSAGLWLRTPSDVMPTMEQYLRQFKLRVLTPDGRIYRQPRSRSKVPRVEDEWGFFPYRRVLALTYLSEGDWILELTSPEGDTHRIPVTTRGRVTEIVRDFP